MPRFDRIIQRNSLRRNEFLPVKLGSMAPFLWSVDGAWTVPPEIPTYLDIYPHLRYIIF